MQLHLQQAVTACASSVRHFTKPGPVAWSTVKRCVNAVSICVGMARSAAATYATKGVRINCVAPGLTKTPATQKFTDNQKVQDASEEMHPLKEIAGPEEIASAIEFFLRPENEFITGQVLAVDGGLSTLHPHHAADYGL